MAALPRNTTRFIFLAVIAATALTACSKQSWYQGVQSAHEAQCLKGPPSEYDECIKQSDRSYDEYEKNRKELNQDTTNITE